MSHDDDYDDDDDDAADGTHPKFSVKCLHVFSSVFNIPFGIKFSNIEVVYILCQTDEFPPTK